MIIEVSVEKLEKGLFKFRQGDVIKEINKLRPIESVKRYIGKTIIAIENTMVQGYQIDICGEEVGLNLAWIKSIERVNKYGKEIKVNWNPMGFMFKYYGENCPIYKVLYHTYGNSTYWDTMLFNISDILRHYIRQYGEHNPKHRKYRKRILKIASKCKISFKEEIENYRKEEVKFYEDC